MKRIFRYLTGGTKDVGLQYPKDEKFNLIGHSDADYAGYKIDKKVPQDIANFMDNPQSHDTKRNTTH